MDYRYAFIAIMILLLPFSTSCKKSSDFRFKIPEMKPFKDLPVQFIKAGDGINLAYRQTELVNPDQAMIIIPGSTMYGYYYVPFMTELKKHAILTRVLDTRGHGDSGGPRGDAPHEDSLTQDLSLHIADMRAKRPEINIYLCGHSKGSGIAGRYLEKFGYDSVAGVIYLAPFFHYRQPGMKRPGYVDVIYYTVIFGGDHEVCQIYHPNSNDPKLVTRYTNMMSRASMISDFSLFRKNHSAHALFLIGKKDELLDWEESMEIFGRKKNIRYIVMDKTAHLDIVMKSIDAIVPWIKGN